jgi:hypothetical protein
MSLIKSNGVLHIASHADAQKRNQYQMKGNLKSKRRHSYFLRSPLPTSVHIGFTWLIWLPCCFRTTLFVPHIHPCSHSNKNAVTKSYYRRAEIVTSYYRRCESAYQSSTPPFPLPSFPVPGSQQTSPDLIKHSGIWWRIIGCFGPYCLKGYKDPNTMFRFRLLPSSLRFCQPLAWCPNIWSQF